MASWAPVPGTAALGITPDRCPVRVSEVADLYALGRLTADQERAFEDHYVICLDCARAVELAQDLVAAIRLTAPRPDQAD